MCIAVKISFGVFPNQLNYPPNIIISYTNNTVIFEIQTILCMRGQDGFWTIFTHEKIFLILLNAYRHEVKLVHILIESKLYRLILDSLSILKVSIAWTTNTVIIQKIANNDILPRICILLKSFAMQIIKEIVDV